MKQIVALMALLTLCVAAGAQKLQEVLYLKNGSVVRGTIVEEKYGEYVKLQTADGSVFVFRMDEVDRKVLEPIKGERMSASGPQSGYRGFASMDFSLGVGDYGFDRIGISTTHGYQFNPHFFLGGGVSYTVFDETIVAALFSSMRYDMKQGSFSPFATLRIGGAGDFWGTTGFYIVPEVGVRFANRMNFSIGVESLPFTYDESSLYCDSDGYCCFSINESPERSTAIVARLCLDFGSR